MGDLSGYKGESLRLLKGAGASVGDVLEVSTTWGLVSGTLVPRYVYGDGAHIVLKLRSGYNVGLNITGLRSVKVVARGEVPKFAPPAPPKAAKGLPRVLIIGTGGTIASRIDYRTGAVAPVVTAAELDSLVPELSQIAKVQPEIMFELLSENITPADWTKLAKRISRAPDEDFDGVVITHGTDTLGYTSAALSFALAGLPIPVILVGSQRSSDRPSSDAPLNLIAAVRAAATGGFSGVYVAMHLGEDDDKVALHRGTRVRKNHTSRRDAFVSVGVPLAAVFGRSGAEFVSDGLPPRGAPSNKSRPRFDERVALLKFYPSMPPGAIRAARRMGAKAMVIEGTGLGHVSNGVAKELGQFVKSGGLAFMTSQCISGRVDLSVYETGRDLLHLGVLPLEDMLSETALVKAMWVLGTGASGKKACEMMSENLAGEFTTRTFPV